MKAMDGDGEAEKENEPQEPNNSPIDPNPGSKSEVCGPEPPNEQSSADSSPSEGKLGPEEFRQLKRTSLVWPSKHAHDAKSKYGGRDVVGYGHTPPKPLWPFECRVALSIVIQIDDGSEPCWLHGNSAVQERYPEVESMHDYGTRQGFWRLYDLITSANLPCTAFCSGMTLERNLPIAGALKNAPFWEIASSGYKSLAPGKNKKQQMENILRGSAVHSNLLGRKPVGYFSGSASPSFPGLRNLLCHAGGFLYDSDSCADDLPYWYLDFGSTPHLVIPQSDITDDGLSIKTSKQYFEYLKEALE